MYMRHPSDNTKWNLYFGEYEELQGEDKLYYAYCADEVSGPDPNLCLKAQCSQPDDRALYMWGEDGENFIYCERETFMDDEEDPTSYMYATFANSSIKTCDESVLSVYKMYGGQMITGDCWDIDELDTYLSEDGFFSHEGMPEATFTMTYDNPATSLGLDCSQYGCLIEN